MRISLQFREARQVQKTLVNTVNLHLWREARQVGHYPGTHIPVKRIVAAKNRYPRTFQSGLNLKKRFAHPNAQILCFIASGNYTTVVITQNHHRPAVVAGLKQAFAARIEIIAVNQSNHLSLPLISPAPPSGCSSRLPHQKSLSPAPRWLLRRQSA